VISRTNLLPGLVALAVLLAACGGGSSAATQDPGLTVETAPASSPAPPPTPTPSPADLRGFIWPIAGGCLPKGDQLMPNAPREYRQGIHEGVDFYPVDNCTPIARGTPVLAAKDGVVVRADLEYRDLDAAALARIMADPTSESSFDAFRGRQVWVDHGSGVVTRYCHLSGVAAGIAPGTPVKAGQTIAFVGESGTPQSVTLPGSEMHLHWELRIGDSYLGKGLPKEEVRRLYRDAFTSP
jgi:murein DD-endopeptidase MepM/ murein hydrolase activator NlpD